MKTRLLLLSGILAAAAPAVPAQSVDVDRYGWQFPVVQAVADEPLVAELRAEVQRILDAGPLSPLYISYADQESVGYTVYQEPGRIVTTLAWAYPHLTDTQKTGVRAYVSREFGDPVFSPWGVRPGGKNGNSNYPLPRSAGAAREDHPKDKWWYETDSFGNNRPFLFTLYGAWLYGFRTGDWTAVDAAFPQIRTRYNHYATAPQSRLYGTLGAHIAVMRLAERAGDSATRETARANLASCLAAGLDFAAVETIARGTAGLEWQSPYGSYPNMYDARMDGSTHRGWMFLNLTPEIGRYLGEADTQLRAAVLARHASGLERFPLWHVPKASYFNRSWTGDEGSGLVPDVMGMFAPVERWVVGAGPSALARQMRGSPTGVGDCYWIEALVQAIEARGALTWRDVRGGGRLWDAWALTTFGASFGSPRAHPDGDWDADGVSNLLEFIHGSDPKDAASTGSAGAPTVGTTTRSGVVHLTFAYTRPRDAWDVGYVVLASTDGATWVANALELLSVEVIGTTERVTMIDPTPAATSPLRYFRLRVMVPGGGATSTSTTSLGGGPVITEQPASVVANEGTEVTLRVAASGTPAPSYQWRRGGVALAGETFATLILPAVQTAQAGSYDVVVSNAGGSITSSAATITVHVPAAYDSRLLNISTRGWVGTGDAIMIPGFVIQGAGTKRLLARGVGPRLASLGVPNGLQDPQIILKRLQVASTWTDVAANDNWGSQAASQPGPEAVAAVASDLGAFDLVPDSLDAALVAEVEAGTYTVLMAGVGAMTGNGLVEIYDADVGNSASSLANVSTRGFARTGDSILIAGFVVGSGNGRRLVIRGVGPGLAAHGVADLLQDPSVRLYRGAVLAAENDNWGGDGRAAELASAFDSVGAFSLSVDSKDSALLLTLGPGVYTVHLSGVDWAEGNALVEVYALP